MAEPEVGTRQTITAQFTAYDPDTETYDPADPTSVLLRIEAPDGTVTEWMEGAMTHVADSGFYEYDLTYDQGGGAYRWTWFGEDSIEQAISGRQYVKRNLVPQEEGS